MKRLSWHRTRVLLLAVLLGLSFVQGSVMAATIALGADGADHKPSGCDGCGGGDHNDMSTGTCITVCAFAALGLISAELLPPPSASQTALQVAELLLSGQSHSPDHGPPKILTIG